MQPSYLIHSAKGNPTSKGHAQAWGGGGLSLLAAKPFYNNMVPQRVSSVSSNKTYYLPMKP